MFNEFSTWTCTFKDEIPHQPKRPMTHVQDTMQFGKTLTIASSTLHEKKRLNILKMKIACSQSLSEIKFIKHRYPQNAKKAQILNKLRFSTCTCKVSTPRTKTNALLISTVSLPALTIVSSLCLFVICSSQ